MMNSSADPPAANRPSERAAATYPEWVREVRAPAALPPPLSCDCQAHLFGDPTRYPARPDAGYVAPSASFADLQRVESVLGFERAVFVQSQIYGSDHRLLLDILEDPANAAPDRYRAIGRVDDETTDADLARMDSAGFCGSRFSFQPHLPLSNWADMLRTLSRIRELGWHARMHVGRDVVIDYADRLHAITDIPVVFDHLGYVDPARGPDQPACRWICDQIRNEDWWVMISNGNRLSAQDCGWDDAVPIARALIEAAPDRIIWGTDWPHVQWRKSRMMNDAEEVELLYRYVDNDQALLRKILVDNPARLHRFG
jgi:2-pyrone-4,6-dicarboxylate lactonase